MEESASVVILGRAKRDPRTQEIACAMGPRVFASLRPRMTIERIAFDNSKA
jgi:hypothetical protein